MQDGRAPRVKNRAPAAIQITAEQILREAQERQEPSFKAPRQRVEDYEELHEYRGRKRKEFEERVRRTRGNLKEWLQYASWEASQGEYDRARSVYERALDVDPRAIPLWLAYTETELKARNINHARNLYDRAVTLLPRVDQLWYKFVYLEELLQNVAGARQIFERWMAWEPDDKAWQAYVKMEERYQEYDRASSIYERWIAVRPEPRIWVKWAKFEEDRSRLDKAREVFQTALEFFGDDTEQVEKAQAVYSAFARMEVRAKEYERARVVYKFAISRLPRSKSAGIYEAYTKFEKQHGERSDLESTVLNKRRLIYEDEVKQDGRNYDAWVDYSRLEEYALQTARDEGASPKEEEICVERVREVYERAIAQIPPGSEKRHWRRYIFLWIFYALFEEIVTQDFERARRVYNTALNIVPHKNFTFAKIWLMFARFEVRRLDLPAARKILGRSIGMCPKPALFKGYIQIEVDLREFDRVRTLYEKYLEYDSMNSSAWVQFAELERQLGDDTRARAIYELGVSQTLSMPEVLWKSYIDYEFEEGERERCRSLYERLVGISGHVRVWLAYASFEMARIPVKSDEEEEEDEEQEEEQEGKFADGDPAKAREVYRKAYEHMRSQKMSDERLVILKVWKTFEEEHGTAADVEKVQAMMPNVVERLKTDEFGNQVAYSDYLYPDDERAANPATFKFLEMARAWKKSGGDALPQAPAPQPAEDNDEQSSGEES